MSLSLKLGRYSSRGQSPIHRRRPTTFLPTVFPYSFTPQDSRGACEATITYVTSRSCWKVRTRRLAISLCNHRDLRGLWPRLRRLPNLIKSREIEKLILLRDIRLPIGDGAAKVKEYLKDLTDLGAHFIRPSPEALAVLDALRRLLSDASAGDLSNRGETVEPQTVQRWLAANMPKVLEDFLEEVVSYTGITVSDETNDLFDRLEELLGVWPVVEADKVASRLQVPIEELAETLRSNPRCLGILDGPPVVIFRLVPDEIDSE